MNQEIVKAINLKKYFSVSSGLKIFAKPRVIKAVDNVSLTVNSREIIAVVGESGSGKTTLGELLVGTLIPTSGKVLYRDTDINSLSSKEVRSLRRKVQMIYQDPFDSVDPRFTIFDIVAEGILAHGITSSQSELRELVIGSLETVGLRPASQFVDRHPYQLSGGQLQRVTFARAAVLSPELIVADEPISMLDVSIKAEVVNSILELRNKYGIAFIFITHDLAWARYVSDRIIVMYLGKAVELADTDELFANPLHPYTKALLAATPALGSEAPKVILEGDISRRIPTGSGCVLAPRCSYRDERCWTEEPDLKEISPGHFVACHLY